MSTCQLTAPINIDTTAKTPQCNLICSYNYNYNDSTCTITNNGTYLELSYDLKNSGTESQVLLKGTDKYNTHNIRIYQPSIHTYNGKHADIELLIYHHGPKDPNNNGKPKILIVSIPYVASGSKSPASKQGGLILENIILEYAKNRTPNPSASTSGQYTDKYMVQNVKSYNMNNFVPRNTYYYYTGTSPDAECSPGVTYIVFDMINSGQTIGGSAVEKLKTLIKYTSQIYSNSVHLSSGMPNPTGAIGDDKIYIDCQPTGQDGEELYKQSKDLMGGEAEATYGVDLLQKLMNSGTLPFLLSLVLGFLIIKLSKKAFSV
jgi:carbonic anhydrase